VMFRRMGLSATSSKWRLGIPAAVHSGRGLIGTAGARVGNWESGLADMGWGGGLGSSVLH
jgi:hypothetical protein